MPTTHTNSPMITHQVPDDELQPAVAYLRLSDYRTEGALEGRLPEIATYARSKGYRITEVIRENDYAPPTVDGKPRGVSAFKRKKIRTPSGRIELRVVRPGFRRMLALIEGGVVRGAFGEDFDRLLRTQRDGEDLIDATELSGATVMSVSGSVQLTNGGTDQERFMARLFANIANKSSADTARRVTAARARLAGVSWGGGPRPFGYEPDPTSVKYRRTLLVVASEAREMRAAAADLVKGATTLSAVARGWNERGVTSVKGKPWTAASVRAALVKPAAAALVLAPADEVGQRVLVPAPWLPIFDRSTWEGLVGFFADPDRHKTPRGARPRYLVSVFAECGGCGGPCLVSGPKDTRRYRCRDRYCVTRLIGDADNVTSVPRGVDDRVATWVVERLSLDDAATLARPAPTLPEVETARLRAERAELVKRRKSQAKLHAAGLLEDDALEAGAREIAGRLAAVERQLALADQPDPLPEFRDGRPAAEVWGQLPIERRRAVVQVLIERVVIERCGQSGRTRATRFDPESVVIVPRDLG